MIDKVLRTPKQQLLRPVAGRLERISPITITLFALVAGLSSVWFAAAGSHLWALVMWLANRLLDGLDGEVARVHTLQSDWGGYVDILSDMLVYAALPLALVSADPTPLAWLMLALMLAVFYLNAGSWMMLSAILEKRGRGSERQHERTSVTMPSGLIEGTETVVIYCLFFLLPGILPLLFAITAALVGVTITQRLVWASRVL